MCPARPFLSLDDITLRLYGRLMFEGTSWCITDDQHWAVIGPNGSGKTTLMRAIRGHVPVVKGRITYHFADGGALPYREIEYVAFDAPEHTLRRTGQYYQARWNVGPQERHLAVSTYLSDRVGRGSPFQVVPISTGSAALAEHRSHIVDLLGIQGLLDRQLIELSDGERRKVSLARALLEKPRLLILDNPFTGLDSRFREHLEGVVDRLMYDSLRVIVVTSRPDEIPSGTTHLLLVGGYRVMAAGEKQTAMQEVPAVTRRPLPALAAPVPRPGSRPAEAHPVLVDLHDVNVSYGQSRILDGVDWTIRRGEHWALLGPNGSGKTTLLSLIAGDHPQAYANDINLFGAPRGEGESIWQIKERIGWVSPELHLYYPKDRTCLDAVCSGFFDTVGLYRRPFPWQRRSAASWMRQLGVHGCAEVPLSAVSEGEQRLVLLARALVKHPFLLILDEPCQGLDVQNRDRILKVVDAVADGLDTSVVYVTHDTGRLPRAITHLMHLDAGKVTYAGPIRGAEPSELALRRVVV